MDSGPELIVFPLCSSSRDPKHVQHKGKDIAGPCLEKRNDDDSFQYGHAEKTENKSEKIAVSEKQVQVEKDCHVARVK